MEVTDRHVLYAAIAIQAVLNVVMFMKIDEITTSLCGAWIDISNLWLVI
jgi:hypothetical protein